VLAGPTPTASPRSGGSGTQPAAAAVIRAAVHALTLSAGTIFVEDDAYVSGPTRIGAGRSGVERCWSTQTGALNAPLMRSAHTPQVVRVG
jgi:hypothetical protein